MYVHVRVWGRVVVCLFRFQVTLSLLLRQLLGVSDPALVTVSVRLCLSDNKSVRLSPCPLFLYRIFLVQANKEM